MLSHSIFKRCFQRAFARAFIYSYIRILCICWWWCDGCRIQESSGGRKTNKTAHKRRAHAESDVVWSEKVLNATRWRGSLVPRRDHHHSLAPFVYTDVCRFVAGIIFFLHIPICVRLALGCLDKFLRFFCVYISWLRVSFALEAISFYPIYIYLYMYSRVQLQCLRVRPQNRRKMHRLVAISDFLIKRVFAGIIQKYSFNFMV